jgi:hypothetical protein
MDQIGASNITLPDMIIVGLAIFLFLGLRFLPPNSFTCRLVALVTGGMVVAIIITILIAGSLRPMGVLELAFIAMQLLGGLAWWGTARRREKHDANPGSH